MGRGAITSLLIAAMAIVLGFCGLQCILLPEDEDDQPPEANLRPIVAITTGLTSDSLDTGPSVRFRWHGADRDGVVRWFQWALDDTITERAWQRTADFEVTIPMQAREHDSDGQFSGWHSFFVRAVDDQGAISAPDRRFFNAHTIAPHSWIASPPPVDGGKLASVMRFTWDGEDLDGSSVDHRPLWFEYKLVYFSNTVNERLIQMCLADSANVFNRYLDRDLYPADSLGDYYRQAKSAWTRVPASVRSAQINDLTIHGNYCFAVRAIDESGALEPSVESGRNRIVFYVGNDRIHVTLCEPNSGCLYYDNLTFGRVWKVTVCPGQPIRFSWQGDASSTGAEPGLSNYGFDLTDPDDDSVQDLNGRGGWIGWAAWTKMREAVSFPLADAGKTHYFYLEMRDATHLPETETNILVEIYVAKMTFTRKFLVIDDLFFAPKPCVGSPPRDDRSDALRLQLIGPTMQDYLGPFEHWGEFSTFGAETAGAAVELPDAFLELIGGYQYLIWDCGSAQPTGLQEAVHKRFLSRYVDAGGSLLMWCDQGPVTLLTTFQYIDPEPACPGFIGAGEFWQNGSGFLWSQLHLRGCVDKPRARSGSVFDMIPMSMVRARASNPLYPDLSLSPDRWVCGSRERGTVRFEGLTHDENEPPSDPWWRRDEIDGELEVLYTSRTFQPGEPTDSLPVAWRSPAAWADEPGSEMAGRVVTFAFHPYYFDENAMQTSMNYAIHWLVTGQE